MSAVISLGAIYRESNAIIEYLVAKYDTENKISFSDFGLQQFARQWLFFQASGQGPYFGQAVWMIKFHPEHLASAIERYQSETKRVLGVLDEVLEGKQCLVGDKFSYADVVFVTWNTSVERIILAGQNYIDKETPNVSRWMEAMLARPAIKRVLAEKAKLMASGTPS
jgi:glutathione S-transferase